MKEYLIYNRDVTLLNKQVITKFFIKYLLDGNEYLMEEFYGLKLEEPVNVIKEGHLKHKDSL